MVSGGIINFLKSLVFVVNLFLEGVQCFWLQIVRTFLAFFIRKLVENYTNCLFNYVISLEHFLACISLTLHQIIK